MSHALATTPADMINCAVRKDAIWQLTPHRGMVYATYDFQLLIKYRYRIDIAIFWAISYRYRIEFQKTNIVASLAYYD